MPTRFCNLLIDQMHTANEAIDKLLNISTGELTAGRIVAASAAVSPLSVSARSAPLPELHALSHFVKQILRGNSFIMYFISFLKWQLCRNGTNQSFLKVRLCAGV